MQVRSGREAVPRCSTAVGVVLQAGRVCSGKPAKPTMCAPTCCRVWLCWLLSACSGSYRARLMQFPMMSSSTISSKSECVQICGVCGAGQA